MRYWPAALVLTVLGSGTLRADNNPATSSVPRQVPYQGRLEQDGLPVTATMNMRFSLFNDPTGGAPIWVESHGLGGGTPVNVLGGAFSVVLGQVTPLGDVIFDADLLYLGVEVEDPATMQPITMGSRQQLFPAAWSLWTERANTFTAAGNITGGGTFTVAGNATVGGSSLSVGPANGSSTLSLASGAQPWRFVAGNNGSLEVRRSTNGDNLYLRLNPSGTMDFYPGGGGSAVVFNTDGTITQSPCPGGTSRIGDSCIDNTVRGPSTFGQAMSTCAGINAHVCRVDEVMACDGLAPPGSDCTALTDAVATTVFYWTGSFHSQGGLVNTFANVSCYTARFPGPTNTDNAAIACDGSGNSANQFWCCRNAR